MNMKYVIISGENIITKDDVHKALREHLEFPEYAGRNLDAAHDVLGEMSVTLEIRNTAALIGNLGDYGERLMCMLRALDEESRNFSLIEK